MNATDFVMDAAGRDGAFDSIACPAGGKAPCLSTDTVVIEPAYGREQFTTSELKDYLTNGPCEGKVNIHLFSCSCNDFPQSSKHLLLISACFRILTTSLFVRVAFHVRLC